MYNKSIFEVLVKNETSKSLTIDVSGLKKPSIASTIWYNVPGMIYETIFPHNDLTIFLAIDNSDDEKGCIKLLLSDGIFFDITFKMKSSWIGKYCIPKLNYPNNQNNRSSQHYCETFTYDDQKKINIISISEI